MWVELAARLQRADIALFFDVASCITNAHLATPAFQMRVIKYPTLRDLQSRSTDNEDLQSDFWALRRPFSVWMLGLAAAHVCTALQLAGFVHCKCTSRHTRITNAGDKTVDHPHLQCGWN